MPWIFLEYLCAAIVFNINPSSYDDLFSVLFDVFTNMNTVLFRFLGNLWSFDSGREDM